MIATTHTPTIQSSICPACDCRFADDALSVANRDTVRASEYCELLNEASRQDQATIAELVAALRVAETAVDDCLHSRSHLHHEALNTIRAALAKVTP